MPKGDTTLTTIEAAAPATIDWPDAVHLVTTSKGGVCKSFDALCLAEFFLYSGREPKCFDADQANATFSRFEKLGVKRINLLRDNEINPGGFDAAIKEVVSTNGPFVIDTGSNSFFAMWDYIVSQDLFRLLAENGRPVIVHAPIAPGADFRDTLIAFGAMCAHAMPRSVAAWLNERDAEIDLDGHDFAELDVVKENADKLLGAVLVKNRREHFHRAAVRKMLSKNKTFAEEMYDAWVLDKARLYQVRRDIFEQLARLGI